MPRAALSAASHAAQLDDGNAEVAARRCNNDVEPVYHSTTQQAISEHGRTSARPGQVRQATCEQGRRLRKLVGDAVLQHVVVARAAPLSCGIPYRVRHYDACARQAHHPPTRSATVR